MSAVEEHSIAGERSRQVSAEEQSRMRVQQSRVVAQQSAAESRAEQSRAELKQARELGATFSLKSCKEWAHLASLDKEFARLPGGKSFSSLRRG